MPQTQTSQGFGALGLTTGVLNKLKNLGFIEPTPIQQQAIPFGIAGRDIMGIAQTGTGKTLAFGIPILSRLRTSEQALVIAPTRELVLQIETELHKLGLSCVALIGGAPMARQVSMLRARPSVLVATPGRLLDHLAQKTVDLRRVAMAVLDEADRMLDMGFAPAIKEILRATPTTRQTMLFSATMPKQIEDLAANYQRDPERIEIARPGTTAKNVEQTLVVVPHEEKPATLANLLKEHSGSVLVFARTRHGARKVAKAVRIQGHSSAELHSDRTLSQRQSALSGFKSGAVRVLVATDIAARGIDVKDISVVINYDLPSTPEDYVHRIGRTGRAGASGLAITIATPEQKAEVRDIERTMKRSLGQLGSSSVMFAPEPAPRPKTASRPQKRLSFGARKYANPASR